MLVAALAGLLLCAAAQRAAAEPITLTVLDPVGVDGADGWQVESFSGANPGFEPPQAVPYEALRDDGSAAGNSSGQAALCARADCEAGAGDAWPGYEDAPVRWVLHKEFTSPRDDMAVVDATAFRADGGARVRINGVDVGLYAQWDQPTSDSSVQVPVTAGQNVIEVEVRDSGDANWVTGQLDLTLLDAPSLSKEFVPAEVELGGTSTLIFTITNVEGAPEQQDFSFTDNLPDGLRVATPGAETDCPGATVDAALDAETIAVTADLAAGQTECTVSVEVRATIAGTLENSAENFSDVVGVVPPDSAQLICNEPSEAQVDDLADVFVECPFSDSPPATEFSIEQAWQTEGAKTVAYQTPLVGDLYGTGDPVAVVAGSRDLTGGSPNGGRLARDLHIFAGAGGDLIATIETPLYNWSAHAPMVLTDVNGDGRGEIIFRVTSNAAETSSIEGTPVVGRLIAYTYEPAADEWQVMWVSDERYDHEEARSGQALNVADFNGDGVPEVYIGNQIFNAATGARLVAAEASQPGGCHATYGACFIGNSVAVNMDGDPELELAAGNAVYDVTISNPDGAAGNTIGISTEAEPAATAVSDGFTAVADIDLDGDPDVIVTGTEGGQGRVYAWDGQSDEVLGAVTGLTSINGAPLVGNIDDDGRAEIVFVTPGRLTAYELRPGSGLVEEWSLVTNDGSGQTSLAMFDFNNDGRQELVYRDEARLRIVDGGAEPLAPDRNLATIPCRSGTHTDMPVIADVEGNGEAKILVNCASSGVIGNLHAFQTAGEPWAPTRPVWNQQSYFVAHVNDDLTVPSSQFEHWTVFSDPDQRCSDGANRPLNAFQQQVTELDVETGCPVICVQPSLEIEKTSDPPPGSILHPGETIVYSVAIENTSSNTVPEVEVTDDLTRVLDDATLSAGPIVTPASAGSATVGNGVLVFNGDIPEDETVTITYTVTINAANLLGDAVLANAVAGEHSNCPEEGVCATEHGVAALSLEKSVAPTLAKLGESVAYSFSVANTGSEPLTAIGIADPLPGLSVPVCQRTELAPGESTTCAASYTIGQADVAAGRVLNTATASGGDPAGRRVSSNPDDAAVVVPPLPADLRVSKRVDSDRATVGDRLTFTIRVRNLGPGTAPAAQIRETPRSGRLLVAAPSQGSCSDSLPLTCALGEIPAGREARVRVVLEATEPGTLLNRVRTVKPIVPDPQPQNNVATTRTRVLKPKLVLTKKVKKKRIRAGQRTRFVLRVANRSRRAIRGVKVCDRMPGGLAVVRAKPRAKVSSGRHCWRIKRLGAGKVRTLRLIVRALPGANGRKVNRAVARSRNAKPDRARRAIRVMRGRVKAGGVTG